jgi:peptidoglycan/LPS O-acetylase OafA/YrhL
MARTDAPPASAGPPATASLGVAANLGYRPHLDGLRAVAVYLVVLFHAGVSALSGGYIGVDVFFVLSGYLVTQVLLRDLSSTGGVQLRRFYARRVRRLLPAASVVLVITAVVTTAMRPPASWPEASDAIQAASLYVSNWFFVAQSTDYFATDIAANPVLHFWSLSVEEQFYLAWPVVLLLLVRVTRASDRSRRGRRLLQGTIAVVALASMATALSLAPDQLSRAYYGTDTRAYQLLAGALLALAPGLLTRLSSRAEVRRLLPVMALAGVLALGLLATSLVDLAPIGRGVAVVAVTAALLVALEAAPRGVTAGVLSWAPLVYLGRISYGIYLWHWILVLALLEETDLGTPARAAVTVAASTALAALSYHVLEHPIRSWALLDRHRGPVIAVGISVSVLIALVVTPAVFDRADDGRPATTEIDWQSARDDLSRPPTCSSEDLAGCLTVEGDGPTVLLIGDSHAAMFTPMLAEVAEQRGWQLSVASMPACSWLDGVRSAMFGPQCEQSQAEWYGPVIDAIDPDLVILSHRVLDDPASPVKLYGDGTRFLSAAEPGDTEELEAFLEAQTEATVSALRADGREVVIIEPVPQPADGVADPVDCLSEGGDPDRCGFDAVAGPSFEESLDRRLAEADPGVWSIDADALVCPALPRCDAVVDGMVTRRDPNHLTQTYAISLASGFDDLLADAGVIDPP